MTTTILYCSEKGRMIKKQKIEDFIDDLSSSKPTPGGGAAAAVSAALAASLVEMVANLTIGKKGYEQVNSQMKRLRAEAGGAKGRLLKLADEDVKAFEEVVSQFKSKDAERIENALKNATNVPLETAKLSKKIEILAITALKKGNKNAYSDAKSAIYLAKAAKHSALENIEINIKNIKDVKYLGVVKSKIKDLG
jgi:formiminotetrahydrofolate cyclodeaminase